jgi:hypothetical protein
MHLDIDEFLNIHVGDGQIGDLIAALPEADAIALTWRMFGNNGIIEFKDRLITDQFARRCPKNHALAMARVHDQNALSQ